MRNYFAIAVLGSSLLGAPLLVGCDDKATSTKTSETTHPDGSTSVDKSKTTTDMNNGASQTTTEHKTTP